MRSRYPDSIAPQPPIVVNVLLINNSRSVEQENDTTRRRQLAILINLAAGHRPDVKVAVDNLRRRRDGRRAGRRGNGDCQMRREHQRRKTKAIAEIRYDSD